MDRRAKIYVSGHCGMVGNAVVGLLKERGFRNLVLRTHKQIDLRRQEKTEKFMLKERPDYVFLFAGKVGSIKANMDYPAEFIYDNLLIEANLIQACFKAKVKKLLFLGSSCIYPKGCPQPIKEEYLLTSELEQTNKPYALAKIAGIELCQAYNRQYGTNYLCLMPTNLYGPHDNFDLKTSHVLPALIRKFHEAEIKNAPSVTVWGTGKPRREFLFVNDLADACLFFMDKYNAGEIINVGTGDDISIRELALLIKEITGFKGKIVFDASKPDGTPQKLLDVARLNSLGWKAKTKLADGIKMTYAWYCQNNKK